MGRHGAGMIFVSFATAESTGEVGHCWGRPGFMCCDDGARCLRSKMGPLSPFLK